MASIGEIKGRNVDKSAPGEIADIPVDVYFGIFFDGTGNNMIQSRRAKALKEKLDKCDKDISKDELIDSNQALELSDNGANSVDEQLVKDEDSDFSNIAALHNAYIGLSKDEREQIETSPKKVYIFNIYVQGAGTNEVWTDTSNWIGLGFGLGNTGVTSLVTKAMHLVDVVVKGLQMNYSLDNHIFFDVFGFSRGATCARMFCHYVNGDLNLTKSYKELTRLKKSYLTQFKATNRKVSFLGIYDTVSSIGINYDNNNIEYGLYSPNESWVEHTCHICAIDEFRDHFRLTDVGKSIYENAIEIYLPGCHSDIGGGYKDGNEKMRIKYGVKIPQNILGVSLKDSVKFKLLPIGIYESVSTKTQNPISIDWLNHLGWYDKGNAGYSFLNDSNNCILNITRPLKRGYSNITLSLMMDKAKELAKRSMFVKDEKSRFFKIDSDLDNFKKENEGKIKDKVNGLFEITPSRFETYRYIRANYLHFSANDSLIDAIVNAPTIDNRALNRIVYHGNEGDNSSDFLYTV